MTQTAAALYDFFLSFGLPAYIRDSVPDTTDEYGNRRPVDPPYITYELKEPEPLAPTLLHAWVWYRDTNLIALTETCDRIKAAIGTGITLPTSSGFVLLFRDNDTPFAQIQPDPDETVKVAYLTMIMQANTN